MIFVRLVAIAVVAALAAPLAAVPSTRAVSSGVGASPVDPARLAAARALIEMVTPAAQRDAMAVAMAGGLLNNMMRAMASNPQFRAALENDPRVRPIFEAFIKRQQASTVAAVKQGVPGMTAALASAYARRFDLAQLREMTTFFNTPTGRAYNAMSTTVMRDPDFAAAQQAVLKSAVTRMQADAKALAAQITALPPRPAKPGG